MVNKQFGQGKKGLLYFAQNPAFHHLTKIGRTEKLTVEDRGLSASNVPDDFDYISVLECEDAEWAEERVHEEFAEFRHKSNSGRKTEFFWSGCIHDAIKYAKDLKGVYDKTSKETEEVEMIDDNGEKIKVKRPNKDFYSMNLIDGDVIYFIKKPEIKATICSKNQVQFEGKKWKLTGLASEIYKRNDWGIFWDNGFLAFRYDSDDENLSDRWYRFND